MHRQVELTIAGVRLSLADAIDRAVRYPLKTPKRYDYPGAGDPLVLTVSEIARTRAVSSRISNKEGAWFVDRYATAPRVAASADLRDADPAEVDGLYAEMTAFYNHFRRDAPRRVAGAKISKVLHLKRPDLFPILDSRLVRVYRDQAKQHAGIYPSLDYKRMFWAAIRADLVSTTESGALAQVRTALASHKAEHARKLADVSDLRLLDILTWRSKAAL